MCRGVAVALAPDDTGMGRSHAPRSSANAVDYEHVLRQFPDVGSLGQPEPPDLYHTLLT
jgi:hypothetical protein